MNKGKTILIIEDNLEMAENISSILKLVNYEVKHAPNGKLGVNLAKLEHPDLIICDIMMPDLDGFGVLHIISKDPLLASVPFIFLTARTDMKDMRNGMNLGADDYITKPFDGLDLLKVIEIRLKKAEQVQRRNNDNNGSHLNGVAHIDFEKLTIHQHARNFRKKDLIFLEGQVAYDLYYIVSGEVKTYKVNYEGKELITGFYQAGAFLGYIPLIKEQPHHESAEVIAIIPKQDFLDAVYSSKNISKTFIKLLSSNVIETENRLLDIAYQSVRQRVAGALLKIHDKIAAEGDKTITITRKDISNLIGTATESLNRTLADFKDEGLIEICFEGIKIIDRPKLASNCKIPVFSTLRNAIKTS
jgi:CRP/FNR family transcriptional regulator, polysaccharide utilization system transcription regulator